MAEIRNRLRGHERYICEKCWVVFDNEFEIPNFCKGPWLAVWMPDRDYKHYKDGMRRLLKPMIRAINEKHKRISNR